jgi:hypothetical protein
MTRFSRFPNYASCPTHLSVLANYCNAPFGVPHHLMYFSSPDSILHVKILILVLKPVGFLLNLEAFLILIFNTLGRAQ